MNVTGLSRGCVCSGRVGILVESYVCSEKIIVDDICVQNALKVCCAEYDDVVQAFAPEQSNYTLHVAILPR